VLAALGRLRAAEDVVYRSVDEVAGMARQWLESDGLVPWPDVEDPVRRSLAALGADAGRLGPDFADTLAGVLDRVGRMLADGLAELRLHPVTRAGLKVSPTSPAMARAVARLREADLSPALATAEQVLRDHLDAVRAAASEDSAEDNDRQRDNTDETSVKKDSHADSPHGKIGAASALRKVIDRINLSLPTVPDDQGACDQARGILVQFLDAYLRPRVREAAQLAEESFTRAGQAALDDALAGFERELDGAEAELASRHAWSAVYAKLIALRAEIG
jgi:hypothetical protein